MEILGSYNPIPDPHGNKQVSLKVDRIKHWMMHGAEPSERVAKLLGLAEVLPPPPRRHLAKALLEPLPEFGDVAETGEGGGAVADSESADGEAQTDASAGDESER
jgi:small subunit ribosomal protein S16